MVSIAKSKRRLLQQHKMSINSSRHILKRVRRDIEFRRHNVLRFVASYDSTLLAVSSYRIAIIDFWLCGREI